ncbi:E3 ubiquitin-protein ligase At1g12760 [Cynara cardunculus var. scolymus]|uniref:E3 ubiquitin-protein ligase At1g12760 n=1 Tax=Cynara cardunculus var. scolymus TaxID=59895 RepID=UPI000D62A59D|nr:E3 ubiquitin-protein ligase At1g12760 [Cynara cardunculus var. scolymus]
MLSQSSSGNNPLLYSEEYDRARRSLRRQSVRDVARFLRRASSRRMMREPSMLVRETAAEQLEERQSDWAHSKPVVILDLIWNLGFVVAVVVVLVLSRDETPTTWLRLWIVGYAVQCVVHMVCVWSEYKNTHGHRWNGGGEAGEASESGEGSSTSISRAVTKYLESTNTMFSFVWWILGFYWVSSNGQALAHDSPKLYWLCVTFLAFDVFFIVFCVALACVIGIAICCCLPCIIAVLYVVADQEGASKEDIELLPKFTFHREGGAGRTNDEIQGVCGGVMTEYGTETPIERVLSPKDAECCICLSAYDDGVELRELPCCHHFHCSCIDKWLYINATCPLCKYNILRGEILFDKKKKTH